MTEDSLNLTERYKEAFELSGKELSDYKKQLDTLKIFKEKGEYFQQIQLIHNWQLQWQNDIDKKIELMIELVIAYFNLGLLLEAEEVLDEVMVNIFNNIDEYTIHLYPKVLLMQGILISKRGDQKSAISLFQYSAELFEKEGILQETALIYNNIGYCYTLMGDLPRCIANYKKSLRLVHRKNLVLNPARTYANLGLSYHFTNDQSRAIRYLKLSIKKLEKFGNYTEFSLPLFNIIFVYSQIGDLESARTYLDKLTIISTKTENIVVHTRRKMAEAMIDKQVRRYSSQIAALHKFEKILSDRFALPFYQRLSGVFISEILLNEVINLQNYDLLNAIKEKITSIREIGKREQSYITIINSDLMLAKIHYLLRETSKANKLLFDAYKLSKSFDLLEISEKILEDMKTMEILIGLSETKRRSFTRDIESLDLSLQLQDILYETSTKSGISETPIMLIISNHSGLVHDKLVLWEDNKIDEFLISSLLEAINLFFKNIFQDDRSIREIKSSEYSIASRTSERFNISYIYKGQSFLIDHKIDRIISKLIHSGIFMGLMKNEKATLSDHLKSELKDEIYMNYSFNPEELISPT